MARVNSSHRSKATGEIPEAFAFYKRNTGKLRTFTSIIQSHVLESPTNLTKNGGREKPICKKFP